MNLMIKLLIVLLFFLFIIALWWLIRRIDKKVSPEAMNELTKKLRALAEERIRMPVFSSETIDHREAEFIDESLFRVLPKWLRWTIFIFILLSMIVVFFYWIRT